MSHAPVPPGEAARLTALAALEVLDTEPEAEFDALVRAASAVCGTPISLVSLVDAERQWFKANVGLPGVSETPREVAFCAHAILDDAVMVVEDASADARFADNPLVTGPTHIRFYAGAPIRLNDGHRVGTLCAIDRVPRELSANAREVLAHLAVAAARALEGRRAARRLRSATVAMGDALALLRTTLNSIADAVLALDTQGIVTGLNPAAERLLGRTDAQCCGQPAAAVLALSGRGLRQGVVSLIERAERGRVVPLPGDAELTIADGQVRAVEGAAAPLRGDDGVLGGVVLVLRDVTSHRQAQQELSHQARHDALTGLPNRREFEARLARCFNRAAQGRTGTLMLVDLDHFKLVNDRCGHAAGDAVLREVSAMLRDSVRAGDTVYRLGGDEFALLLERSGLSTARALGKRLCERFDRHRFSHGGQSHRIGLSIGIVAMDSGFSDIAALLQAADRCCYAAKEGGRGRVVAAGEDAPVAKLRSGDADWAARLEQALDEHRFELHGQLVVPLHADAGVVKVELLLRLREPDGRLVAPGLFLGVAERFQIMSRIDRWVLQETLSGMDAGGACAGFARVGVNLSGQSLSDPSFRTWALAMLKAAGRPICGRLTVEVTESVAISHLEDAASFFADVRALGTRIALDDFGTGTSSFAYLKRLPVDYLKIDGQFVRGLLTDPIDAAVVASFVQFAQAVGIKTVAEFVDEPATLERLRAMGVGFAQGFLLHKPEPLVSLTQRWPALGQGASSLTGLTALAAAMVAASLG